MQNPQAQINKLEKRIEALESRLEETEKFEHAFPEEVGDRLLNLGSRISNQVFLLRKDIEDLRSNVNNDFFKKPEWLKRILK